MTRPFRESAELRALLDALCEESITAEQLRRLEELVLNHPEAEACYVQYLSLHADLASHFSGLRAGAEPLTCGAFPPCPGAPGSCRGNRLGQGGDGQQRPAPAGARVGRKVNKTTPTDAIDM
jgi:hypothetical protein